MQEANYTIVVTTLNETDILVGQVYCKAGLLLRLKEGWLHGLASGNDSNDQN